MFTHNQFPHLTGIQQGKVIQNEPQHTQQPIAISHDNNNNNKCVLHKTRSKPGEECSYDSDFPIQFLFDFQDVLIQTLCFYIIVVQLFSLLFYVFVCVCLHCACVHVVFYFTFSIYRDGVSSIDLWMIASTTIDSVGELQWHLPNIFIFCSKRFFYFSLVFFFLSNLFDNILSVMNEDTTMQRYLLRFQLNWKIFLFFTSHTNTKNWINIL